MYENGYMRICVCSDTECNLCTITSYNGEIYRENNAQMAGEFMSGHRESFFTFTLYNTEYVLCLHINAHTDTHVTSSGGNSSNDLITIEDKEFDVCFCNLKIH